MWGRVTAEKVSRQPFTVEAQVKPHCSLCGICVGHGGTGRGFFLRTSVFPCKYRFLNSPHSLIHLSIIIDCTIVKQLDSVLKWHIQDINTTV